MTYDRVTRTTRHAHEHEDEEVHPSMRERKKLEVLELIEDGKKDQRARMAEDRSLDG